MEFFLNHESMGEFLRSRGVQDVLVKRGELAAEVARAHAPVGTPPDDEHPGQFRDSIHVKRGESELKDRTAARLVADAPHAAAVEFGNRAHAGHHVLASVIDVIERG